MSLPTITGTARVLHDVELRHSQGGKPWISLSLLFQGHRKDDTGAWVEADSFKVNAVAFGDTAETIAAIAKKGSELTITGALKTSTWTDKNGEEQSCPQIVIREAEQPQRKPRTDTPAQSSPAPEPATTRREVLDRLSRQHDRGRAA